MNTGKPLNDAVWRGEFSERLDEAKRSLDSLLRDGAIECPVFLYFRASTENRAGERRLARVQPAGDDWQVVEQPIRMNTDVRSIMAQVTALARSLPVLSQR